MIFVVAILLLVCLGFPLAYSWKIWGVDVPTRSAWLLLAADAAVFFLLIMLVGRWDIAGFYSRYALSAVFAVCLMISWRRHRFRPWRIGGSADLRGRWPTILTLVFFGGALIWVIGGMLPPGRPAKTLAFPLEGGNFVVAHGGTIGLLNHHAGHRAQRFALDIVAIGPAGFRAAGILPKDLDRYAIFGTRIVSPCNGRVLEARDGLPDLSPPNRDRKNLAGNHVILDCGGLRVELAHMREGSVASVRGSLVATGQLLGRVGNSGNTTEPHLHVHVVDSDGNGVPIAFGGTNPVRNDLYRN